MIKFHYSILVVCALGLSLCSLNAETSAKRPNILWFVVDDMSANFSCYGEKAIQTPHVDRLAEDGERAPAKWARSQLSEGSALAIEFRAIGSQGWGGRGGAVRRR